MSHAQRYCTHISPGARLFEPGSTREPRSKILYSKHMCYLVGTCAIHAHALYS